MKKLCFFFVSLLTFGANAQTIQNEGYLYAADFNAWSIAGQHPTSQAFTLSPASACTVSSNGYTFPAFTVGQPIRIVDANPNYTETVIVTGYSQNSQYCSVSANMLYPHTTYSLRSGSSGLQEAINYAGSSPSLVILTPAWGGSTAMITAAKGSTLVSILDQRTSVPNPYLWTGGAYLLQQYGGNGGSAGVSSFGGRVGSVNPSASDYSSFYDPLGAASSAQTAAQTFASNAASGAQANAEAYTLQSLTPYAKLASPNFSGTPSAPTPAAGTSNTQIATTAFVASAVAGVQAGQGTQGPAGPTGATGPAPTISTTATTLAAGSQATATTTSQGNGSYSIAFGIPQGQPGTGSGGSGSGTVSGTPNYIGEFQSNGTSIGNSPLVLGGSNPASTATAVGAGNGLVVVEPKSTSTQAFASFNPPYTSAASTPDGTSWLDLRGGGHFIDISNWGQTYDGQLFGAAFGSNILKTKEGSETHAVAQEHNFFNFTPGYYDGGDTQGQSGSFMTSHLGVDASAAIHSMDNWTYSCLGAGDCNLYSLYSDVKPMWLNPSDENVRLTQWNLTQTHPYHGTMGNASTAGNTSLSLTPTMNGLKVGSLQTLIDLNPSTKLSGTVTAASNGVATVSGVTLPASNQCSVVSGVTITPSKGNIPQTGTMTLSCTSQPTTGQLLSLWGGSGYNNDSFEVVKIASVATTGTSGQYQITAPMLHTHTPASDKACIGGVVGDFYEATQYTDTYTGANSFNGTGETNRYVQNAVCSTATTFTFGEQYPSGWTSIAVGGAFNLWPGAYILDPRNPATGTLDGAGMVVSANNTFAAGDAVESPAYIQAQWGLEKRLIENDNPYSTWTESPEQYIGDGTGGFGGGGRWNILNANPDSAYSFDGGPYEAPYYTHLRGPWGSALVMQNQPMSGQIDGCALSGYYVMFGVCQWDPNGPSIMNLFAVGQTSANISYDHNTNEFDVCCGLNSIGSPANITSIGQAGIAQSNSVLNLFNTTHSSVALGFYNGQYMNTAGAVSGPQQFLGDIGFANDAQSLSSTYSLNPITNPGLAANSFYWRQNGHSICFLGTQNGSACSALLDSSGNLTLTGSISSNGSSGGSSGGAPLNSPQFTGTPTAPTNATATDNTTQLATDAFTQAAINAALAASGLGSSATGPTCIVFTTGPGVTAGQQSLYAVVPSSGNPGGIYITAQGASTCTGGTALGMGGTTTLRSAGFITLASGGTGCASGFSCGTATLSAAFTSKPVCNASDDSGVVAAIGKLVSAVSGQTNQWQITVSEGGTNTNSVSYACGVAQ